MSCPLLKPSLLHMALHVFAEFSTVKQCVRMEFGREVFHDGLEPLDASRLAQVKKSAARLLLFAKSRSNQEQLKINSGPLKATQEQRLRATHKRSVNFSHFFLLLLSLPFSFPLSSLFFGLPFFFILPFGNTPLPCEKQSLCVVTGVSHLCMRRGATVLLRERKS